MPTVNSNTVSLTLTSTWKCTWADDDHNSTYVSQASTTDTQSASFSAAVPAGATITGRILKTTWSNTGTVQTAQVNGAALGASVDSRAVSSMVHNYTWRAAAAAMYNQGTYSRYMYVSAYIEVTYTNPKSGLSLNKTTMDAGTSVTATITPQSTAYTHKLTYTFGSEVSTKTLAANVKTWSFTVPLEWLAQVPNATSKVMTVKLETFSGATNLGNVTKNVTILVPSSVVPTITGFTATLVSNGVDASITQYVQNYSKCLLEITGAEGAYGSTIVGYSITGGGISGSAATGTFGPFNMSGDVIFTAKVTDGRGRTATRQVAIDVMPYSSPAFSSPEAWRSNYDGVKNQKGTYVRLKSGVQYSSLEGQNDVTLKGRVYLKGGTAPGWESMTPDTAWIAGGGALMNTRTYVAQLIVQDKITSKTIEFVIPTKRTGLSIMAGMQGAAVGRPAETPGIFESLWPIVAPGIPPDPNTPNPNILHNWDFRNPVNQRGESGEISTAGYFYDRWLLNSGAVTTNDAYLTVGAETVIEQRIEGNLLAGAVVTVSVMVSGEVYSGTGTFPTSAGTASVTLTGWGTATLGYVAGYMYVRLSPTAASNVQAVKCELGTVSTLHLDPPMDYTRNFLDCARYYFVNEGIFTGSQNNASCRLNIPLLVPMRILPTYEGPSTFSFYAGNGTLYGAESPYFASMSNGVLVLGFGNATSLSRVVISNTIVPLRVVANADL